MAAFGYLSVASHLHDNASVERMLAGLTGDLAAAGGVPARDPDPAAPLAVVVLTGGTELEILRAVTSREPWEPVVVVAHPWHNSLPAALEAVARLHQDGRAARIGYLDGGARGIAALAEAAADHEVALRLRGARIGVVGEPSEWLVASRPDPDLVRASWGPRLVPIEMAEALAGYDGEPAGERSPASGMVAGAGAIDGPTPDGLAAASRACPALRKLVARHRLDALTVRCFDLVTQRGTSGCLALAALNDEGVTAGCEGDIPSTIGMIWTRLLLGQTPWMANPAQIRFDDDVLVLAHCTIAPSLTTGYAIQTHFESGLGAALAGTLPAGPVTLVRVDVSERRHCLLVEGEAIPTAPREDLCRTQLAVRVPSRAIEELLAAPLGNHLVVVRGHHRARLSRWLAATRV